MVAIARILTSAGRDLSGSILVAGDEILLSISLQNIPTNLAGASVQLVLQYWDGNFLALLSSGLGTIVKTAETSATITATCTIAGRYTAFIEQDDRIKYSLQLVNGQTTSTISTGEFGIIGAPDGSAIVLTPDPTPVTISGVESRIEVPFSFGDAQPKLIGLPIKGYVPTCAILITTPFNGSTPSSLSLGVVGAYSELVPPINPSEAAEYEFYPTKKYTSLTQIYLSIALGEGVTQGAGLAIVDYADV